MESKAASQNVHEEYCRVLNIDIPLYHTTEVAPAVPFTLHLAHHTLSSDTVGNKYLLRKGIVDPLQNKENGQLYLSMLDDCNNTIYSSELIQESTIGKIQMFLKLWGWDRNNDRIIERWETRYITIPTRGIGDICKDVALFRVCILQSSQNL